MTPTQSTTTAYYAAAILMAAIWSGDSFATDGPAAGAGAFTGNLVYPALVAAIWWFVAGRKKPTGKVTTARIAFWVALVVPPLIQLMKQRS